MGPSVRLRDLGGTYGGLTGKTKADFGHSGTASFITFLEVINSTRLQGLPLARVQVGKGETQNRVLRGDLLFNGSSETPEEVALSAVVDFEPDASTYLNSFCFGYRLIPGACVDPTFLAYFFRSSIGRALVSSLAQGSTRYNIAKTKFLDLELDLPSADAQRATVQALTDADESAATLERVIAKKQAIKLGMMQQLLTGKSRLSGFDQPWSALRLRDAGATYGGLYGKTKDDFGSGSARFVTFMEVIEGARLTGRRLEMVRVRTTEFQNCVARGDVLFNGSSETPEDVALSAVVEFEPPARTYLNSFCFGYRINRHGVIDPTYLAYFFRSDSGRAFVSSLAQGAIRYNIAKTKFLDLCPLVPTPRNSMPWSRYSRRQRLRSLHSACDS